MEVLIRLLPTANADGAANMAADEVMVHSAAQGIASLRCYGWTGATISLGYFQHAALRWTDPLLANLPWVRRPSGGATLVHHHELTYALALPPGAPWQDRSSWMLRMHYIITQALEGMGRHQRIEMVSGPPIKHGDVLCFQQYTEGDLLCRGKKIVGSAQRKYHQAMLQHGSILLAQSEYTPALPGIRELTGDPINFEKVQEAVLKAFIRATCWRLVPGDWTTQEQAKLSDLLVTKYATDAWNARR